jgi:hypothetical protein
MKGQLSRTVLRGPVGSNAHLATRLFGKLRKCRFLHTPGDYSFAYSCQGDE